LRASGAVLSSGGFELKFGVTVDDTQLGGNVDTAASPAARRCSAGFRSWSPVR
jgi:hypothetical protein